MAVQNARMFPPGDGRHGTIKISGGRSYTCAVGNFIDVPLFDAHGLSSNGWTRAGGDNCFVGPTSARPTTADGGQPLAPNQSFIDTSIGAVVTWRPPVGGVPGTWVHTLTGAPA